MKKIIILMACIFTTAISANAQDIITKKDGSKIEAKIVSVSDLIVDYKRTNYLDGPTFSISVHDIDFITYSNGDTQSFEDNQKKDLTEKGIALGMDYKDYKKLYDTHNYVPSILYPYSPALSGVCSFFIPGLGQTINGQIFKGLITFTGTIGLTIAGFCVGKEEKVNGKSIVHLNAGSIACWCGALAIDIWSIVDAAHVAKIKNMYWDDCQQLLAHSCEIKLSPDFSFTQTGLGYHPTAGIALAIKF